MANIFHAILSSTVAVALRVAVSDVGEERPPVSFESLDVTLPKSRSHHRSMIATNNRRSDARKSDWSGRRSIRNSAVSSSGEGE